MAPALVTSAVLETPAAQGLPEFGFERGAILSDARSTAAGRQAAVRLPAAAPLVEPYRQAAQRYGAIGIGAMLALALAGGLYG